MKYVCSVCGYVYDESENTPWSELSDAWKCPLCGAAKSDFSPDAESRPFFQGIPVSHEEAEIKPLNAAQTGALCSSLAKGCEKQYLPVQADAFRKLADWFTLHSKAENEPSFDRLISLVNADLSDHYPAATGTAREKADRGALRCLTWSEKVTKILKSLLERYAREGEAMLENTGVYVCTICGFVCIGDDLPEVCPVCKAPRRKFEKIGG